MYALMHKMRLWDVVKNKMSIQKTQIKYIERILKLLMKISFIQKTNINKTHLNSIHLILL